MKKFETPTIEVEKFEIEDVVTTSSSEPECNTDFCAVD